MRERHPRIGGLLLALSGQPQHEVAWQLGARGEETVARLLASRLHPGVIVLHDRAVRGTRANVDHIAVAPSGVWVIDSKHHKGKVAVSRPLFGDAKLTIAGRDKTKLIDGLERQVDSVRQALPRLAPAVPIHGALCFLNAELPLLGTPAVRGFPLLHPKGLAKRINARGGMTDREVRVVAVALADRMPRA